MDPEELSLHIEKQVDLVGEVTQAIIRTRRDGKPFAIITLELLGGGIEVLAWPNIYERDRSIWQEGNLLLVRGKVKMRDNKPSVYVDQASIYIPPVDSQNNGHDGTDTSTELSLDHAFVSSIPSSFTHTDKPSLKSKTEIINSLKSHEDTNRDKSRNTVVIKLTDTGDASEDAFVLKSALQLLLEYPGSDRVLVEIESEGRKVRLEMPLIKTKFCQEMETRMAEIIGSGKVSLLSLN
mgnify:CR=1 FL=1